MDAWVIGAVLVALLVVSGFIIWSRSRRRVNDEWVRAEQLRAQTRGVEWESGADLEWEYDIADRFHPGDPPSYVGFDITSVLPFESSLPDGGGHHSSGYSFDSNSSSSGGSGDGS